MTSEEPFISVVTAVLNGREKIARTIESVRMQGFEAVEYIAIDGGSTDGTVEILREIQGLTVAFVSEPDRGISHAFNKGIAMARGEFIGILNAGDQYEPGTFGAIASAAHAHPEADVICGSINLWEGGSKPLRCDAHPELLEFETSVYHPAVFVRKSAYERSGGYDESFLYAMDYELMLRLKREGREFISLPKVLANMSLDGISSRHWYEGLKEVRRARARYFSPFNTSLHHGRAILMNVLARALKAAGLTSLYRAYRAHRDRITRTDL